MTADQETITVIVGIFSGRPNPEIQLRGESAEKLAATLQKSLGKETIHAPPAAQLGQFYGFTVKAPQNLATKLGIPTEFSIFEQVVSEPDQKAVRHWRDIGQTGQYLLKLAYAEGLGELLEKVGAKNPD